MIFIDNKYTRWYYTIVHRAQTRTILEYTEKHHIIPKSCGGNNSKDNLVSLTAKEHFICHLLLTKMTDGQHRHLMVYAFHGMKANQNLNRYSSNLEVTAKIYQSLKEELSLIKRSQVPWNKGKKLKSSWNKGKPMSEETKQKIREARANQDMSYRKGVALTEEQKLKQNRDGLKKGHGWNKGKKGTGFGNPATNPMNNPDSIKKMLETRKLNKEKKLSR